MRLEALKYLGAAMTVCHGDQHPRLRRRCGGGETDGDPCTFDEDCPIEQVCDSQTSQCIFTCQDGSRLPHRGDLSATPQQQRLRLLASETQPTNNGTNNPNPNNTPVGECTPDTQEADCGPDGFCDETNNCVYPEPESIYQAIVIQDTSAGDPTPVATPTRALTCIDVYLLNSSGEAIGYGFKIWLRWRGWRPRATCTRGATSTARRPA